MKIKNWLENTASAKSLIYVVPITVVFEMLWTITLYVLLKSENDTTMSSNVKHFNFEWYALFSVIWSAVSEEMIFRLLPLFILPKIIFSKIKLGEKHAFTIFFIFTILSSLIFGIAHGNYKNILIQGFGGLVLCVIFLKYGGYHTKNKRKILKGILASITTHLCYILVILLLSST